MEKEKSKLPVMQVALGGYILQTPACWRGLQCLRAYQMQLPPPVPIHVLHFITRFGFMSSAPITLYKKSLIQSGH
jgi:hypothetical protein